MFTYEGSLSWIGWISWNVSISPVSCEYRYCEFSIFRYNFSFKYMYSQQTPLSLPMLKVWLVFRYPFHWQFVSLQLKSRENYFNFNSNSNEPIRSQICTYHDTWAVMTCAKSWPDWMIIFQVRTEFFIQDLNHGLINPQWNGSPVLPSLLSCYISDLV